MLAQVSYASAQSSNKKEVMQKKETMQKQGSAKKEVMQQKGAMQKQGSDKKKAMEKPQLSRAFTKSFAQVRACAFQILSSSKNSDASISDL